MKNSRLGWVQRTLFNNFRQYGERIAIRDCTQKVHHHYTYAELYHRVEQISRHLVKFHDQKAILLIPGDANFVFAFIACALAGVTAVPVNLPGPKRLKRVQGMLEHIFNDCNPDVVLALSSTQNEFEAMALSQEREVLYIDQLSESMSDHSPRLDVSSLFAPSGPTLLQYSSGSTGKPKAVANYDENIERHHTMMEYMHPTIDVIHTAIWLPFFHDLGLFYGLLYPLFSGGCCSFMRPSQFIANPYDWMKMISDYRANAILAPDFAYRLCADTITNEELAQLDLSCLEEALTAAEPIRPSTLDAFIRNFKSAGFRPEMFMTGYGMAEATLVVGYQAKGSPLIRKTFDEQELAQGKAVESPDGRELVSSGNCFGSWELLIVDPQTRERCSVNEVGEIWLSGPCLPKGYWNKPTLTHEIFNAQLLGDSCHKAYLRTGDLAFLHDHELFICGRLKDVIIVAGENHMPNDIEATIEKSCNEIEIGGACAVQRTESGDIYLLCEVHRHTDKQVLEELSKQIYALVAKQHKVLVRQIVLVAKGKLKKTSSGKIRRQQMLNDWMQQQVDSLSVYDGDFYGVGESPSREASSQVMSGDFIRSSLQVLLGCDELDESRGFSELGVSSVALTQWCTQLSEHYGFRIAPPTLFAYPNLHTLRQWIFSQQRVNAIPVEESQNKSSGQVAIVAISCRLPGQIHANWLDYARWLAQGESAISEDYSGLRHFQLPAGFIQDIDKFDAAFFGISGTEAKLMDPQQRWMMEASWHLFEQAGWCPDAIEGQRIGIVLGQGNQDYADYLTYLNDPEHEKSYLATGSSRSALSGRLAKFYGTQGPAITLDTACSSSLVAIDVAASMIQSGDCPAVIAGGVNGLLSESIERALINAGMLSPRGRCATLSADADGYARGEGLGLLLLKDYEQAQRDGDPVIAVIEGCCVGQDGKSSSLTAPNPLAQQAVIREALKKSNCSADDIDAVELHGTGTQLGDPIELSALDAVYGERRCPLPLTAAKAQLGHLETAAGVAGLIRAVAQMHHQSLFGHPTYQKMNPHLASWFKPGQFVREARPLKLIRMGISSMGFTGTLAHLILRHEPVCYDDGVNDGLAWDGRIHYFPVSAFDHAAKRRIIEQWLQLLQSREADSGILIHAWLNTRSHSLPDRCCIAFRTQDELLNQLSEIVNGTASDLSDLAESPEFVKRWLAGEHHDWKAPGLTTSYSYEILGALPVYPFAKTSYWVVSSAKRQPAVSFEPTDTVGDSSDFLRLWVSDALCVEPLSLDEDQDLIASGLDSLQLMDLVDEAKKRGVKLALARIYEQPTLSAWTQLFRQGSQSIVVPLPDAELPFDLSAPFELTSVQRAYLQGRRADQVLGGVACQVYLEFNLPTVEIDRLNQALRGLLRRHSMLRLKITPDGRGRISENGVLEAVEYDWSSAGESDVEQFRSQLREQLQNRVSDLNKEPGLSVAVSHGAKGSRLHINVDMVIADALSIHILLKELAEFYDAPEKLSDITPTEHFPRYLQYQASHQQIDSARDYWHAFIDELPAAPDFPLEKKPESIDVPQFVHREWRLEYSKWAALQAVCRERGVTPSMLLAACYAETLRGWSKNSDFCLNLTLFNRRCDAFDISEMVADFTTLMLLPCRTNGAETLFERAHQLNRTFVTQLDYSDYDAVQVVKELSRRKGYQVQMPVVFTSNLGHSALKECQFGQIDYMVSQTPQVWVDCQVLEQDGDLILSWDSVDELFPEQMIEQMFDAMSNLIHQLSVEPELLDTAHVAYLSEEQRVRRFALNQSSKITFQPRTLHDRFFELAGASPERLAVIDSQRFLTYGELAEKAKSLAYVLYQQGVSVGDRVAVLLPKGHEQVVAVLAAHLLGAAYVPLDVAQPENRIRQIISQAHVAAVIVGLDDQYPINENHVSEEDVEFRASLNPVYWVNVEQAADTEIPEFLWPRYVSEQVAYIIYTSGSTGVPKGVVTTHQAAANTIDDIVERISLTSQDRVLALSALNFDLSVFDIFAPLSVGGALVMPDSTLQREAKHWLSLIEQYDIRIWNSVPALFEMLLIVAECGACENGLKPLRQVLLSGDWIGLDLQPRLEKINPATRVAALGGATEAAIWSNWFDVRDIPTGWKRIPYGHALSNQSYRVMDQRHLDCPDWVTGELWIGGCGVAQGYYADLQRTADQFVTCQGERYYRTGDLGRFWPDGTLEFLGRIDNQIKIGGYRIELGEVEHVAAQYAGINRAVALFIKQPKKHIQLFVESDGQILREQKSCDRELAESNLDPIAWYPTESDASVEHQIATRVITNILSVMLGSSNESLSVAPVDSWCQRLNIIPTYKNLLKSWLDHLVARGCWSCLNGEYEPMTSFGKQSYVSDFDAHENRSYRSLIDAFDARVDWFVDVLQGRTSALTLLDDADLSPEVLVLAHSESKQFVDYLCAQIQSLSTTLGRPVNVVELNGREGRLASLILMACSAQQVSYRLTESASSMRDNATFRLSGFGEHVQISDLNFSELSNGNDYTADIVISNNALHRFDDVAVGISSMAKWLAPGGHFFALETQQLSPLALLTVCVVQPDAFSATSDLFSDSRQGSGTPLLEGQRWQALITESSLCPQSVNESLSGDLVVVSGRQSHDIYVENTQGLQRWLHQHLPAYMLPESISLCPALPLSANGKVDRKQLLQMVKPMAEVPTADQADFDSENEALVAAVWASVLGGIVTRTSNFFQLGGDSLHATRLVAELEKNGVNGIQLSDVFHHPVLCDFAALLKWNNETNTAPGNNSIVHRVDDRYSAFEVTHAQRAYLTGRKEGITLGGVGTHFYSEFDFEYLDVNHFEQALIKLIARHDTLRIQFDGLEKQRVLPEIPYCPLVIVECEDSEWESRAAQMREELSHRVLDPTQCPLFHFTLLMSEKGRQRLCVGLDNLILDGLSMRILFAELGLLYREIDAKLPPLDITFKDYIEQVYSEASENDKKAAEQYWLDRLPTLPDAPQLPLVIEPGQISVPQFKRRSFTVAGNIWHRIKTIARQHEVTPSCLLLNCYATVLARWSLHSQLTINVTLFDRQPVHENINHIMGDFTSLLLLETEQKQGESWAESTQRLQQRLWDDLAHADVSAVWVMRELARLKEVKEVSMPVVFTSALGADTALDESTILSPDHAIWGVSQTPQVWIDHQVYEHNGALHFNWDVVDELFPAGLVDAMFESYCRFLVHLDSRDWTVPCLIELPEAQQVVRQYVNHTEEELKCVPMHLALAEAMITHANKTAIVLPDQTVANQGLTEQRITYSALSDMVCTVAAVIRSAGVSPGECVGVMLPRSVEQIAAIIAVQWVGAAYVPIAYDWPQARVTSVVRQAQIQCVLTDSETCVPDGVTSVSVKACLADKMTALQHEAITPYPSRLSDRAYVIFTSGSTGEPKGVEITHGSAMNTIQAINAQYEVSHQDTVLALSAAYFDLSVYDLFGLLSVGGTLVLIEEHQTRDVSVWLELVRRYHVTLWNSVPALMDMALLKATASDLSSLRCVMLSGDWIPLTLPDKLWRCNPAIRLVSMGGATEASIWSNYWTVETIEDDWKSVPYGYPLPNQCFRVVNMLGEDCPDWVTGELVIGGDGVAQGYMGNESLTQKQFYTEKRKRWYRTGDLGRYHPEGWIEFIGRKDHQVKVGGLRIELGEVEHAICQSAQISDARVFIKQTEGRPQICAYCLAETVVDVSELHQALKSHLPGYSLPNGYAVLSEWPLTANGKIDQKTLLAGELLNCSDEAFIAPETEAEKVLTQVLMSLLERQDPIGVQDNFFAIGGDSFTAIQLTSILEKEHRTTLALQSVFNLQTIKDIAAVLILPEEQSADEFKYEEGSL